MKLNEVMSPQLKTEREIIAFCNFYGIEDYYLNDKLEISTQGPVYMTLNKRQFRSSKYLILPTLPVRFNHVNGDFLIAIEPGIPAYLESLDGFPKIIEGSVMLRSTKIASLHNIHKYIHSINGELDIESYSNPVMDLLGVLLIKNITLFNVNTNNNKFKRASIIINTYIDKGTHDINACQEELIDANLAEYARL